MLATIHKYILREMGRTFILTAVGLTAVLTTCGGIYNLTRLSDIGPRETLILMALVIPMFSAITLPIAALFSATATYGRLAADNEFTACRSSGVNMFVLLLPCVAISLVSAIITFAVFNFVIPGLMQRIGEASRDSVKAYMVQTLKSGRHLEFQGQRMFARRLEEIDTPVDDGTEAILTRELSFIQHSDDAIVRVGAAASAAVKFDLTGRYPRIKADLADVQVFDLKRETRSRLEQEALGPFEPKLGMRMRPKYLYLSDLVAYRDRPEDIIPKLAERIEDIRQLIVTQLTLEHLEKALIDPAPPCEMGQPAHRFAIHAARLEQVAAPSGQFMPQLLAHDVEVVERTRNEVRRYRAATARLEMRFVTGSADGLAVTLNDCVQTLEDGHEVRLKALDLQVAALPDPVVRLIDERYAGSKLWARNDWDLGELTEKARKKLRKDWNKASHEFYSEIHMRTVYSLGVIVLAVLGAVLGVIFRGGHLLVAFAISVVPAFFVMLMTIWAKGVAKGEHTLNLGLALMWGGLVVVALAQLHVLRKYYPR